MAVIYKATKMGLERDSKTTVVRCPAQSRVHTHPSRAPLHRRAAHSSQKVSSSDVVFVGSLTGTDF